jgi:hypothetical protein
MVEPSIFRVVPRIALIGVGLRCIWTSSSQNGFGAGLGGPGEYKTVREITPTMDFYDVDHRDGSLPKTSSGRQQI